MRKRPSTLCLAWLVVAGLGPAAAEALAETGCEDTVGALTRPFIGTWTEFQGAEEEETLGILVVVPVAGGCGVSQRFESADGSFGFVSLAAIDPGSGELHETLLFSHGGSARYRWRADGEDVLFERLGDEGAERKRLRATEIGPDSFVVLDERSGDEGRTWSVVGRTPTRRRPAAEPAARILRYCTPHGEFDLRFGSELSSPAHGSLAQLTGYYSIAPRDVAGRIAGTLDGHRFTGRWFDDDGEGDIVLDFAADWSSFSADYRSDEDPETWYRDWRGALRPPTGEESFERDGTSFRCDRASR